MASSAPQNCFDQCFWKAGNELNIPDIWGNGTNPKDSAVKAEATYMASKHNL